MNNAFLMRALNGLADRHNEFQPFPSRKPVLIAEIGDRDSLDQLHHKIGPPGIGGTPIQDPGDIGMVHECQRLPFGLEASDHLPAVHARLDDLQRHQALDRLLL